MSRADGDQGGASVTLATPRTYRTIGAYRSIGDICAKFIPNSLEAIGGRRRTLPHSWRSEHCGGLELAKSVLRDATDPIQAGLVDEQRTQHEVGRLQRAAFPDATAGATLLPEGFEQHAVHRPLHEARLENHELTGLSTAGNEALDQLVEQRDALSLIGELVQPEHRVLIEATGVERLDQGLAHITRDGEVELLSPRRIRVEAGADAVD